MGAPDPLPVEQPPQQLPSARKIIENSRDILFDASANAKNITISTGVRRFDTAQVSDFGACVRANMTNRASKDMGLVTYVVTVANGKISDKRRAVAADGCDKEKYEPL